MPYEPFLLRELIERSGRCRHREPVNLLEPLLGHSVERFCSERICGTCGGVSHLREQCAYLYRLAPRDYRRSALALTPSRGRKKTAATHLEAILRAIPSPATRLVIAYGWRRAFRHTAKRAAQTALQDWYQELAYAPRSALRRLGRATSASLTAWAEEVLRELPEPFAWLLDGDSRTDDLRLAIADALRRDRPGRFDFDFPRLSNWAAWERARRDRVANALQAAERARVAAHRERERRLAERIAALHAEWQGLDARGRLEWLCVDHDIPADRQPPAWWRVSVDDLSCAGPDLLDRLYRSPFIGDRLDRVFWERRRLLNRAEWQATDAAIARIGSIDRRLAYIAESGRSATYFRGVFALIEPAATRSLAPAHRERLLHLTARVRRGAWRRFHRQLLSHSPPDFSGHRGAGRES